MRYRVVLLAVGLACFLISSMGNAASTFTQVSAGFYYTCATRTDGTLACWGYNSEGQVTAVADSNAPSDHTGWSLGAYAGLAGAGAAAVILLAAGGWYARRRWWAG